MKTAVSFFCSLLVLSAGCSSTQQVELGAREQWLPEAQHGLLGKDATVITRDGRSHDGQIVQLSSDTLELLEDDSHTSLSLQLTNVSAIRPSRQVFPPIAGLVIGLIAGGAIGGELGTNAEVEKQKNDFIGIGQAMGRFGNMMEGAMIGAAVGGVSLSVILGLATSVTDYQIAYGTTHHGSGTSSPTGGGSNLKHK